MIPELSSLAARVREFIAGCESGCASKDESFERLALDLFALQFRHVEPYRRLCEARGIAPETVHHWSEIPAVPTSVFKEFELSSIAPQERKRCFRSSGTTGQAASRHFHSTESLALYEASLLAWWRKNMLTHDAGKVRLVLLTPPPDATPHSSLVHMFATLRREFGSEDSVFLGKVDEDGGWVVDAEAVVRSLADLSGPPPHVGGYSGVPVVIMGTAFSFVHLLDWMTEQGIKLRLPAGSKVMETGGYKGRSRELSKSELHRLITERLGVPEANIVCEYGMSEMSSQAYDEAGQKEEVRRKRKARVFYFPPWVRVQVVSPESGEEVEEGETGIIRIIDLANVWSVMAVQTEDLGVRRGSGFEFVGRAALAESRGCSLMAV